MNKKSFFLGVLTGIILTFIGMLVIGFAYNNLAKKDSIQYLEKPVSYENKNKTTFRVLQVLDNAALANEASDKIGGKTIFLGNTVLILGENFYCDQIVTVRNPQRIGTYDYTSKNGRSMTVPVIDGEME